MYRFQESYAIRWPKPVVSSSSTQAIADLISRVLDGAPTAKLFQVEVNPDLAMNGKDVFELLNGSTPGTILISASSGVAAAWGFNYYLKYVTNSSCMIHFNFTLSSHSYHMCSLLVRQKYSNFWFDIDSIIFIYSNCCK